LHRLPNRAATARVPSLLLRFLFSDRSSAPPPSECFASLIFARRRAAPCRDSVPPRARVCAAARVRSSISLVEARRWALAVLPCFLPQPSRHFSSHSGSAPPDGSRAVLPSFKILRRRRCVCSSVRFGGSFLGWFGRQIFRLQLQSCCSHCLRWILLGVQFCSLRSPHCPRCLSARANVSLLVRWLGFLLTLFSGFVRVVKDYCVWIICR
jgi:hypothetical protein